MGLVSRIGDVENGHPIQHLSQKIGLNTLEMVGKCIEMGSFETENRLKIILSNPSDNPSAPLSFFPGNGSLHLRYENDNNFC